MKYCYYQVFFCDTLTERKLKNHFDDEMIQKAFDAKIISHWKDNQLFFNAYNYCKETFGKPTEEQSVVDFHNSLAELETKINKKEAELQKLKLEYAVLCGEKDPFDTNNLF